MTLSIGCGAVVVVDFTVLVVLFAVVVVVFLTDVVVPVDVVVVLVPPPPEAVVAVLAVVVVLLPGMLVVVVATPFITIGVPVSWEILGYEFSCILNFIVFDVLVICPLHGAQEGVILLYQ